MKKDGKESSPLERKSWRRERRWTEDECAGVVARSHHSRTSHTHGCVCLHACVCRGEREVSHRKVQSWGVATMTKEDGLLSRSKVTLGCFLLCSWSGNSPGGCLSFSNLFKHPTFSCLCGDSVPMPHVLTGGGSCDLSACLPGCFIRSGRVSPSSSCSGPHRFLMVPGSQEKVLGSFGHRKQ